ncbi:MAG: SDR family NAD(P)-dependent oxidoreductase [Geminicoccaceae bacterium]
MPELVWLIGASTGIGRSLALRLARDGATVVASARSADRLQELAAEAPAGRIVPWPVDVTDLAALRAAADGIEAAHGAIAVAVLNAGTHKPVSAAEFTVAGLRELMELNVFGVANALEVLMPRMIGRRSGQIAVVASVAGYRGLPTAAYYGASKAALINMAESLKFDLDRAGVKLQLIDPGFVRTPLTDRNEFSMPFLMEPDAAADRIARGLKGSGFEIAFPRRFVAILKLLRILPYRLYFALVGRGTGK